MNPLLFAGLFDVAGKVLDKIFPDPEKRAAAQMELLRLERQGELDATKVQLSSIIAEASSPDPWTSRARPSFMYVIYVMILMGIPMGFVSAFRPDVAMAVADGMRMWLAAIPSDLYTLFGAGYLGYTGARSLEKARGIVKKK